MALSLALKVNHSLLRPGPPDREPKKEAQSGLPCRQGGPGTCCGQATQSPSPPALLPAGEELPHRDTEGAMLAEIQNGCKRNFVLVRERE